MSGPDSRVAEIQRLFKSGQLQAASERCRQILSSIPDDVEAWHAYGVIGLARQEFKAAASRFERAIALQPNVAALHLARGQALRGCEDITEAIVAFQKAIALAPSLAEAHHQLGNAFKRVGRYDEAAEALRTASKLEAGNATIWLNLGVAELERGQRKAAIACFHRACELAPKVAEARNILGVALLDEGLVTEASEAFRTALSLRPDYAAARSNLARLYKAQGRIAEATTDYRAALALGAESSIHSNLVYALNFFDAATPADVFAEHARWGEAYAAPLRATQPARSSNADPNRRLRVGFVSPDFVNHAVAYFFEPLLMHRDRSEWEVFCYSDAPVPDRVTERLEGASDHWRDSSTWTPERLAEQIRADQIDVLIDLAGHTARHRLLVFARKPAPVQATWLGYPNTTGVRAIDFRITDSIADPEGRTEKWHVETLVRTQGPFVCYQPPSNSPGVADAPVRATGQLTLGSFSNLAKLSDACLTAWGAVLAAVPDSVLLLKSPHLGDAGTKKRVEDVLAKQGVAPDRLRVHTTMLSVADHLSLYGRVDVALDPFPYNGTTTTCEALWMGVPVLTLAGETHVARVGASLLTHLGRPDWIADSIADYVAKAIALAEDVRRGRHDRAALRAAFQRGPLCDAPAFAAEMKSLVRAMWQRSCTS